jgi:hypothetical protein
MVEIDLNAPKKYRPFNFDQARQGAPIKLRGKNGDEVSKIRVLAWDVEHDRNPIVAAVRVTGDIAREEVRVYDKEGNMSGQKTGWGYFDLVMAPAGNIDGTDLYWGDKVYHRKTGAMHEINRNWPGVGGEQTLKNYALQPPTVEFQGRPLTIKDTLWHKDHGDEYWRKVKMDEHWTTSYTPGVDTTHFGRIKSTLHCPYLLVNYSWDFPLEVTIEGKKLEIGEKIWFKHNPEEAGVDVSERLIELVAKKTVDPRSLTRRAWIKRNNWQAEAQVEYDGSVAAGTLMLGPLFNNETECNEKAPALLPEGYKFLTAKVVSSYFV